MHNFGFGNFDIKDTLRSGRQIVENADRIIEIVGSNRHISTTSFAERLKNTSQETVWNHLKEADYKKLWMSVTRVVTNIPNEPIIYLRIADELQQLTLFWNG